MASNYSEDSQQLKVKMTESKQQQETFFSFWPVYCPSGAGLIKA